MRVLTMSDAELDKLEIIRDVDLERMPALLSPIRPIGPLIYWHLE